MIPLRDENPSRSVAVLTVGLIALNCAVFFFEIALGPRLESFMFSAGLVPARVLLSARYGEEPFTGPASTFITSMFMHGGWAHLIGNMWYLWIFGDNVEDRLGHLRFLLFYLAGGVVAATVQVATALDSDVPIVGASGAVAAVLGAYIVMFPKARVVTLIPFFPVFHVTALPAAFVLGLWMLFQFFSGALALSSATRGGVAWWAHIGGFLFGMLLAALLGRPRPTPSRAWVE